MPSTPLKSREDWLKKKDGEDGILFLVIFNFSGRNSLKIISDEAFYLGYWQSIRQNKLSIAVEFEQQSYEFLGSAWRQIVVTEDTLSHDEFVVQKRTWTTKRILQGTKHKGANILPANDEIDCSVTWALIAMLESGSEDEF